MTGTRDPSVAELVGDLTEQTSRLVRDEMRLARAEFARSAKHASIGAGFFGAAGLLAIAGFAAVVVAAIAAIDLVLPLWAAALIVAAALLAASGVAVVSGRSQSKRIPPPLAESVDSVKRDVEELRSARDRN